MCISQERSIEFLQRLLVDPPSKLQNDEFYIKKDLIIAAWMMNGDGAPVEMEILRWIELVTINPNDMLGRIAKHEIEANFAFIDEVIQISSDLKTFSLCPQLLEAMKLVFNQTSGFDLVSSVPFLNQKNQHALTGIEFMQLINRINQEYPLKDITTMLAGAWQQALNCTVEVLSEELALLKAPNQFEFLMAVAPSYGVVRKTHYEHLVALIGEYMTNRSIEGKPPIKTLFVSPSLEGGDSKLVNYPFVYHLRSLSLIRFLHSLKRLKDAYPLESLVQTFEHYFPAEPKAKHSSVQGIQRWESAIRNLDMTLNPDYIIPYQSHPISNQTKFGVVKQGDTLRLYKWGEILTSKETMMFQNGCFIDGTEELDLLEYKSIRGNISGTEEKLLGDFILYLKELSKGKGNENK